MSVRLVHQGNSTVMTLEEALKVAEDAGLDLVEISPTAVPPVCKVVDYGKFLYEQKKKPEQKSPEMKELRFSPSISDNDFNVKVKQALKFLQDGSKVKTSLQFRGREMAHKERGELVLLKFAKAVEECAKPETLPKLEGKKMFMLLMPIKKK